MPERRQTNINPEAPLNTTQSELLSASGRCLALARLLKRSDPAGTDAEILIQGAAILAQINHPGARADLAKLVISQGFTEDGPKIPPLARGLLDLIQQKEPPYFPPQKEDPHRWDEPPQIQVGNVKCVLDDSSGKFYETVNKLGALWLERYIQPPFCFGRHGDFRYMSFSPFYKQQQIIARAFFAQKEGNLLLPKLGDVFVYSVGNYRGRKRLFETWLPYFSHHFFRHAGQLVYKIHHLDEIQPGDFTGWKKFKETMDKITMEYREVLGHPISIDDLVKIALREQSNLWS